ncbi:protein chiffon isoform X2 [Drosophila tropicalis]|uniref:protein chiffon isoform X2 n=1 Tax=Drosophila tropicalis TaxID=46794 RepID=UPI0035AB9B7C
MQPRQSDKPSASSKPATATTAATTTTPTTTDLRPKVKVIKSKRPLCHFKFYLDICDHQLAKRVEQDIKSLGGQLEFFLSDNITHFITDKPQLQQAQQQQQGQTPQPHTPLTPNQSPLHQQQLQQDEVRKTRQSRADAILSRVRRQTSVGGGSAAGTGGVGIASSGSPVTRSYIVWQTDYAQRFFKRIQTELKAYLEGAGAAGGSGSGTAAAGSIHLKGQFVKIESIKRNYRPYYHLIKQPEDWPKLQLDSEDGAFRLQEKRSRSKSLQSGMTTRKSTEDQQQQQQNNKAAGAGAEIIKKKPQEENIIKEKESSDKQCGVCEICKLEYDTLSLHLQSKDHELFAKNPENFLALDSLIQTSANVKEFLLELNDLNEMEEQLNSSSGSKSSPALREKSKRITKGKHSSEKFASPPATKQNNSPALVASSLNGGGTAAAVAATATTTPSRRSKVVVQNSGLSPPIRAMLPPSSLYKVVETIPRDDCSNTTPLRRGRTANNQNVDSPSLIVKFQKVRQSELQRLNGEAENFMFPRTTAAAAVASATTRRKSSSELATDIDRQTTSDIRGRHSISSASLDTTSTSEADIASGGAGAGAVIPTATASSAGGRAQLVARRRKLGNQPQQHQRFPKTPIQPESELKQEQQQQQEDLLVVATRKSSRMATAIVTAATTSNQLQLRQTNTRKTKLEDRMGDNNSSIQTPTKTKNRREVNKKRKAEEEKQATAAAAAADIGDNEEEPALDEEEDDEVEEQEDEESSCCPSSGSDEDYVANRRRRGRQTKQSKAAARRQSRLTINRNSLANKSSLNPNNTINQDQIFDCSKSERLTKMRYTFESLPTGELWHRVFNRQDRGEEEYYTYYGSTRYRKLPYEMGPIPMMKTTQLGKHKCRLCPPEAEAEPEEEVLDKQHEDIRDQRKQTLKLKKDDVETIVKREHLDELPTASTINATITSTSSSSSLYKHKKLHLLQRYQQEQLQQQQQQQQCDSKASTPELLEREFGSLGPLGAISRVNRVRSSSSSSCSNSQKSVNTCRNKQLARLTELPPRKSPREHASTLALVSCIIRQRQDSQNSKTNSEAEDPPPPPIKMKTPPPRGSGSIKKEPDIVDVVVASSPRTTRSQAATPIEELRFATEISETVKRMRRGQNKYDHSPPAPATAPPLARQQRPNNNCYSRRLQFSSASVATTNSARRRPPRSSAAAAAARSSQSTNHLSYGMGIRKLPSKKGLLEYEMEPCAMKALDASMQYRSPHLMAWQIDKYLELVGKEYDFNDNGNEDEVESQESRQEEVVTPPPTDCNFTSEFDLCDLLQGGSAGSGDDDPDSSSAVPMGGGSRRLSSTFSLYSSYYRKRKSLKSNRTGWPKAQRRRHGGGGSRHLAASDQRICFKEMGLNEISTAVVVKQEPLEAPPSQTTETTNAEEVEVERSTGDAVVMTPPATDVEPIEAESLPDAGDDDDADDDEDEDDDDDEEEADEEAEIEATDADVEEEEEEEEDVYEDAFEEPSRDLVTPPPKEQQKMLNVDEEPPQKRSKLNSSSTTTTPTNANTATTPTKPDSGKKLLLTLHNGQRLTSTPSSTHHHPQPQQPQQQQRLNGSLGSCISPSEKLGDNSDIFTVSSDGLDTDLDLSNHQADCPHQQQQTTSPPKRKFDISKYAPPNNGKAASSCAAEAATAAVKSLAISQFLKKEVRVTCRRLRAPFRRFRYRR